MATILAHIVIKEGHEGAFEELAVQVFTQSHATEKALRAYGYWRGAEPRNYYTLLAFDDYLGFMAHQTSSHHEDAGPGLRDCIESMLLEWVDPIAGASKLVPSNEQEIPADASALMRRYAAAMPVKVGDWWLRLREKRSAH